MARRAAREPARQPAWTPPEGWSRLVVWLSPAERRALKRTALEADTTVARLVRGLAAGLVGGVVDSRELLDQVRKGVQAMEKIPTIFERGDDFRVIDRPQRGCEWVFQGEGRPTEKVDGTNVRLTIRGGRLVRLEKRRNPTAVQKKQGVKDGWYVDADEHGPEDKWIFEAARRTKVDAWPDGEHSCEALGPHIQGNPLGLAEALCVPFNLEIPVYQEVPRTYDGLRQLLAKLESRFSPGHPAEGIVFHHPDGRRAKIKRKDFAGGGREAG